MKQWNKTVRSFLTTALVALTTIPAFAGLQHPAIERGFKPEKAFQVGDLDNVNLFNGNLAITLPLGQEYTVGGGFNYKLTLVYNSKAWDWELYCPFNPSQCQNLPMPAAEGNAGLGWTLTLGELVPPETFPRNPANQWMYISADGAEHLFYPTLHPGDWQVPGVEYSRDGSYLRMKQVGGEREIEHPDGTIHRFDSQGRLRWIKDRLANQLSVAYSVDARGNVIWTLTDGFRTHYVRFEQLKVDGTPRQLVNEVDVAAFGGARARYKIFYREVGVERPCPYNAAAIPNNPVGQTATVQFLDKVVLPDGTNVNNSSLYWMRGYQESWGNACAASGALTEMQLPTLGHIAWGYGAYFFPTGTSEPPGGGPGGGPNPTPGDYLSKTSGVTRRTLLDANRNPLGPSWTYLHKITHEGGTSEPAEITNTVIDPENVKTIHYFSTYPGGGTSVPNASIHHYGLPFSVKANDNAGRYISKRVHKRGGSQLLRTTYVRYEHDPGGQTIPGEHGEHLNLNRRLASQRIVYHDDGGNYVDTDHDQWDNLGHYRRTKVSANNGWSGQKTRWEKTNYNPGGMPSPSAPWILETYDETWQQEWGRYASQTYCFEAGTGFLARKRSRSAATRSNSNNDVVLVHARDGRGNVTLESYHGGDNASVSLSGNLCTIGLPAADYAIKHWYSAGARRRSTYQSGSTNLPFNALDLTIDSSTGLASLSRDVSGLATTHTYDKLGRLTKSQPSANHGARTEYLYNRAISAGDLADVRILDRANNGGGTIHRERQIHFDVLGRVWREKTQLPTSQFVTRETRYNVMGWKTRVSEQELTPSHWTDFLNFDEFGRAKTVRPPDGAAHDINFTFFGVRAVDRTVKIQQEGGLLPAITKERYDNHGRLHEVTEPAGGVLATYTYDRGNRLKHASIAGSGVTQTRQFIHDGRGFLTAEWMPELGAANTSGAWRRYSAIDARGHATKVDTDDFGVENLVYTFDKAERLIQIRESASTGGRELKKFVYGTANSGNNLVKGKLWQAFRHNYVDIPWTPAHDVVDSQVVEEYEYRGKDGRPSRRDTNIGLVGYSFFQQWAYDELGDVTSMVYPRCLNANCVNGSPGPPRTQSYTHTRGWLTAIPGFADSISYHPNGMVNQVVHRNGSGVTTRETMVADPWGMRRPLRFDYQARNTNGSTLTWNSGTYTYDGVGNIVTGNTTFRYDRLSRIVRSEFNPSTKQVYSYDNFGNLHQVATTTPAGNVTRSLAMDSRKNRLSANPIIAYDARGNLTVGGANVFTWDPLDKLVTHNFPEHTYLYTADGERIYTITVRDGEPLNERLTLRGLDNKLLRVWEIEGGDSTPSHWKWKKDYIYRGGVQLAAETSGVPFGDPNRFEHFFVDHLGSTRATTNKLGHIIDGHRYFAFGQEPPDGTQFRPEVVRFTGHERDHNTDQNTVDDLDYMHARYYSPHLSRFLSIDPARESAVLGNPQSWNRYSYALNNPIRFTDPSGESAVSFVVKLVIKGGDVAATTAGVVSDFNTLVSGDASLFERGLAAVSLASEAAPVSVRDVVTVVGVLASVAAGSGDADGGGSTSDETLSRQGTSRESAQRLERKATEAQKQIGIHGVSVTAGEAGDVPSSQASRSAVESEFKVHDTPTRRDSRHKTVELPKPVTRRIADTFNRLFGRIRK